MFYELWIASRFIKARRRERIVSVIALISMLGIAVGVAVLIVVISVMSGFDRYLEDKMVGIHAHIAVETLPDEINSQDTVNKIKSIPQVVAVAPFVSGVALIKKPGTLINVQMRGIDPQSESNVSKIKEYLKQGDFALGNNDILIGQELAQKLFLKTGDSLTFISAQTIEGAQFNIKGIFNSGMYLYDSGLVIGNIKGLKNFLGLATAQYGFSVKINDIYKAQKVKDKIQQVLGGKLFEAMTWMDLNKNFLEALKLEKIVMFIVVIMTTVVAAFGIANTLILSVIEKTKDIGIMRAIGVKVSSVANIFLFQGLGIGTLGIVFGLIGGLSLAGSLNKIIDFISKLIGRNLIPQDIYYFERLPVYFNLRDILAIIICAFLITLLASIYPAYHASRLEPSEALKYE